MTEGKRFDAGKPRYDLLPEYGIRQAVNVFTYGSKKYEDRNWENGLAWSRIIGPLKRHTAALERGEDYDYDENCPGCTGGTGFCDKHSGLLHAAHIVANGLMLTQFYKTHPEKDDRPHRYLSMPKIGLDIDEVICDWQTAWCEKFGHAKPGNWYFSYELDARIGAMKESGELEEFYAGLKPKVSPDELGFEPHCYITSRPVPLELTLKWLQQHGFATRPVYSMALNQSKVDVALHSGLDWFVDDRYENFVELNRAGICCFLMDAPHNQRYKVGYKRIYKLSDLTDGF